MTVKIFIVALFGVIAVFLGGAIAHLTQRKPKTAPPPPESNIDAARRRATERAARPKRAPPPAPEPPAPIVPRAAAIAPPIAPTHSIETPTGLTVTLVHPHSVTTHLPSAHEHEKDAWQDWTNHEFDPYRSGHNLTTILDIQYVDTNDQTTQRRITTERYAHNGRDGILHAYCHMRQSRRSFRIANIAAATCSETGEMIHHLPAWLDEQYSQSDAGTVDAFVENHEAALTALFFIAKADGAFRQPEKTVVSDFCESVGCDISDKIVSEMTQWAVPSKIGYGKALRALAEQPDEYQLQVYRAGAKMLSDKRSPRDAEKAALERMRSTLGIDEKQAVFNTRSAP